ncbi:hypothetical protein SLS53_003249 [Cytospora paraplurivora]|uniref:HhH-GPD domain-containing protein n=1 Tax=Cytospora paraplurivora TaxID=2898453 RepID=A0AAN9UB69_9PEZI
MESAGGRQLAADQEEAREILEGFLIDEAAREFLVSLISSAKAPNDEVSRLYDFGRSDPLDRDREGEDGNNENDAGEDDDTSLKHAGPGPTMTPIQPVQQHRQHRQHIQQIQQIQQQHVQHVQHPAVPEIEDADTARDLLYGFNIHDDDFRDFLIPMITSGAIPEMELQKLYDISLSAGIDDFEMQIACAKSLRDAVLDRSYSDDLTVYLGMVRQCERITEEDAPDSASTYWPVGVPALTEGGENYGGAMCALERQGQEILNGLRRVSHSTDMDDDEDHGNSKANKSPSGVPQLSNGDSIGEVTDLGAGVVKKTKAKGRRPPTTTGNIEIICPLPGKDGSVCGKRFRDGKPYRSVQEHIRRAHEKHYIPKLPATKESFDLIVNTALRPAEGDGKIEVVCPLPTTDGSVCGKRCYDGKAYRSMQEHIRKTHPLHYIPGLNANEESFRLMVGKQPGDGLQGPGSQVVRPSDLSLTAAKKQPAVKKVKVLKSINDGPNEQAAGVVRPADLVALPAMYQQPAAKRVKESRVRSPAKSPFFADLELSPGGFDLPDPTAGLMPAQSMFAETFGGDSFLPQFDMTHDGNGGMAHLRNGMDSTISRSLFPQHFGDLSPNSTRKRKRDEPGHGVPEQTSGSAMSHGMESLSAGQFSLLDQSLDPQAYSTSMPSLVAPGALTEMADILNGLQDEMTPQESEKWDLGVTTYGNGSSPFASPDGHMMQPSQETSPQEQSVGQEFFAPTAGHFNPPLESTAGRVLQPKPIPFKAPNTPSKSKASNNKASSHFFGTPTTQKKTEEARTLTTPSPKKSSRPARNTVSALPIPPLTAENFGLVQEEFAKDPFRLLIVVTFLVRTPGRVAIPTFRQLMDRYPTPEALAAANPADLEATIHHLGLSNQRTETIQKYARMWVERPPCKEVRYGVKNYPLKGDGKDVRAGEVFGPEDVDGSMRDMAIDGGDGSNNGSDGSNSPDNYDSSKENDPRAKTKARGFGTAWEIGHLTAGRYAMDSWRIFCRDVLLGRAEDWKGRGREATFQPEWMRVLPEDKELRACLKWMWMKEGWDWDPKTGEKVPLSEELRLAVDEGRVAYDSLGQLQIVDQGGEEAMSLVKLDGDGE